jgi:hypothetical protein
MVDNGDVNQNLPPDESDPTGTPHSDENLQDRVDRLGMGEPAPDISAEEFARLQRAGNIHLDPQGRVRANRHEESDPGISLRKRRAWYALGHHV